VRGLFVLRNAGSGERLLRVDEERERAQTELDEARRRAEHAERRLAEALERLDRGGPRGGLT
jgi:hypothetical protein